MEVSPNLNIFIREKEMVAFSDLRLAMWLSCSGKVANLREGRSVSCKWLSWKLN